MIMRGHKEAKAVVCAALTVQANTTGKIGNSNLLDEVYSKIDNVVLCPSMIAGYCEHLNELLQRGT
ncbi:hypothetical protein NVP1049O_60 [Vibrio phage 1.049.O._10N.286.54.B5]|nr:hypothetical protein NVP1049O_60 [Vibrio phage 1.049.O._10N.286.54.B5]AUR84229.1 hypothetical protein NVP1050O_60 [Vibrio phage 1.050.O._10N.286.48.A6]